MGQKNCMKVVRLRLRFTELFFSQRTKWSFILNGVKSKNKVKMKAQWTEITLKRNNIFSQ